MKIMKRVCGPFFMQTVSTLEAAHFRGCLLPRSDLISSPGVHGTATSSCHQLYMNHIRDPIEGPYSYSDVIEPVSTLNISEEPRLEPCFHISQRLFESIFRDPRPIFFRSFNEVEDIPPPSRKFQFNTWCSIDLVMEAQDSGHRKRHWIDLCPLTQGTGFLLTMACLYIYHTLISGRSKEVYCQLGTARTVNKKQGEWIRLRSMATL